MEEKLAGKIEKENLKWLEIEEILNLDLEKTTSETLRMIKELKKLENDSS